VADLAPAEADRDLDAIPLVEELGRSPRLGLEVMDVDLDRQPHLFEALRLLLLLLFALALLQLVLVLAVVENAADRRDGGGRHLDEVEPLLLCQGERVGRRHDAQLLPFIVDDPDLADADHFVDAKLFCDVPATPQKMSHRPRGTGGSQMR
jgi:hypothetical protein